MEVEVEGARASSSVRGSGGSQRQHVLCGEVEG